jgi:hypothetical protein
LFAGEVEEGATLSVSIDGTIRIGKITSTSTAKFNKAVAEGSKTGITVGNVGLVIYGEQLMDQYEYSVKPDAVTVESDGTIKLGFYPSTELKNEKEYIIQ